MPKIDIAAVPARTGSGYPPPFDAPCAGRTRRRLGEAGGLRDFGVNLMTLPPGSWSSQRHWHSDEDEFVYVLEGEVTLIEDDSETVLHAGDCAAFPKATGNGHHLINKSSAMAVYLEVGSRNPLDLTTCSDVDMMSSNADGRFVHRHALSIGDRRPVAEVGAQVQNHRKPDVRAAEVSMQATAEQRRDSSKAILFGASDAVATLPRPWRIAGQLLMALGIGVPAIGSLLGFPFAATFTLQMASLTAALLILREAGAVRLPFIIAFAAIPVGFLLAYLVRTWQ